jgi:hypothetical protein
LIPSERRAHRTIALYSRIIVQSCGIHPSYLDHSGA